MLIDIGKCVKMPNGTIFSFNKKTGEMFRVEITKLKIEEMYSIDIYQLLSEIIKK